MKQQVHKKIKAFIEKHQLIEPKDELVLGISGGADSMMLLHYFYSYKEEYDISLKVAHIHHGLREAAELDARLVEETCKQYGIPFYRHNCQIKVLAACKKISEEEAGREERYNFFISLLNPNGKIVTAHNMNDQAETMLMRFVRGTDITGLAGILPRRDQIIRPLLCLTRKEIEAYCKANHVAYRHDETNFKPIYTRNKMRLECIPYMEQAFNPSLIKVLGDHSELYQEEDEFLRAHTEEVLEKCICEQSVDEVVLDEEQLAQLHPYMQKRILLAVTGLLIGRKDITSRHLLSCTELMHLQTGKEVHLPNGLVVKKDYKGIIFTKEKEKITYCIDLELGSQYIDNAQLEVILTKVNMTEEMLKERIGQKNENIYTKYIDYGRIKSGLQIRTRRPSDFIQLGGGTKKLKKLFIDDKISKTIRDTMPLIADGDEIVWIIGSRLNIDYYMTECTKELLEIQIRRHE